MATKVLRLKLFPHDYPFEGTQEDKNNSWKRFRQLIRDIAYQSSCVKNSVATKMGLFILQSRDGEKPEPVKDYVIAKAMIKQLRERIEGPIIALRIASTNARMAKDAFSKEHGKEIWKGNRALPTFRRDGAVYLNYDSKPAGHGNTDGSFRFEQDKVRIACWSKTCNNGKYEGETYFHFPIATRNMHGGQRVIFDRILRGVYKAGVSTLILDRRDIFLNVTYTFENCGQTEFVKNRVVGVDVGMKKVAVCSCSDNTFARLTIHDEVAESIRRHRQQNQRLKKSISKALRPYTEKRAGHGVKNKIRTLEHLSGRERDFQKTVNHQVSRAVVNFAKRVGAKAIAVEDLTNRQKVQKKFKYLAIVS